MNPPKIGGSRVHPEFRDPPPLFGVSGYLVRPKNSGVPLMDGVPLLYREDPPKFEGPERTPKLRDPLAVPWVPWSHSYPPQI